MDRISAIHVILNAHDWGCSPAINAAAVKAHRQGVLTSASLMVTGDAFEDVVRLARATPTVSVGVHLALVNGRVALAHKRRRLRQHVLERGRDRGLTGPRHLGGIGARKSCLWPCRAAGGSESGSWVEQDMSRDHI